MRGPTTPEKVSQIYSKMFKPICVAIAIKAMFINKKIKNSVEVVKTTRKI